MTIRMIDDGEMPSYEAHDNSMDRSLFVDVLSDGILLSIQYNGFDTDIRGQLILSLEDINALTVALNELDRWV